MSPHMMQEEMCLVANPVAARLILTIALSEP